MAKTPALAPASSIAIRMPLTMVVVCAFALPVRGRLETILIVSAAGATAAARTRARLVSRRIGKPPADGNVELGCGPARGRGRIVRFGRSPDVAWFRR